MKRGIVQWAGVFFSASMLVIAGCASSDAGTDEVQVVPDDSAQVPGRDRAANAGEAVDPEDESSALAIDESEQALQQGLTSVTVPGLTIRGGGMTGSYTADSDWTLHEPSSNQRVWSKYISFPAGSFSSTPNVIASIGQSYANNSTSTTYVRVTAEDVNRYGFNLNIAAGADTILYSATARWIAFGDNN